MTPAQESIRSRFLAVDTTTVSDVLEKVGLFDQALSTALMPIAEAQPKLAGFAYTVRMHMLPYEGPGDPDKMQAINGMMPGVVSVWAGDAEGMASFGELLALGMKVRGCMESSSTAVCATARGSRSTACRSMRSIAPRCNP